MWIVVWYIGFMFALGVADEIEGELRNLAKSTPDLKTWQQQAIKVKGVAGNSELLSKILSGELYERLK